MLKKKYSTKSLVFTIAIVLVLISGSVGLTLAFLKNSSNGIENRFTPTVANITVKESFDGTVKKNVTALNSCTYPAYVRIKLISYRVNDAGNPIGGVSSVPTFTPGSGWLPLGNDTYVYSLPVAASQSPTVPLIGSDGITLVSYSDDEGGKQMVQVIAECIQATPATAVESAWGVTVTTGDVLTLSK